MSTVLVTGGAGFIGSHVVDRVRAAGLQPRILDVRPSPHHGPGEIDTVIGDIRELDDVRRAARGCDAILHLAAAADVNEVAADPAWAEQLNARGTLNVLEAARELEIDRVVYASTIWVYSDVEADRVDEDTPLRPPAHLYTATKLAGELYCRSYAELYEVDSTVLRFGIPYGPRARPAAVVPAFVTRALAGETLTIQGSGDQSRRFVYVEDLAEGVVSALAPAAAGRTYNLVGGEDVSVRQIAETVRDMVGDVQIVHTEGRAGDFRGVEVSGARAAAELGWTATTRFDEGARRYLDWHVSDAADRDRTAVARAGVTSREQRPATSTVLALRGVAAVAVATMAGLVAFNDEAEQVVRHHELMILLAMVAVLAFAGRRTVVERGAN